MTHPEGQWSAQPSTVGGDCGVHHLPLQMDLSNHPRHIYWLQSLVAMAPPPFSPWFHPQISGSTISGYYRWPPTSVTLATGGDPSPGSPKTAFSNCLPALRGHVLKCTPQPTVETWATLPLLTSFSLEHTDEIEPKYMSRSPGSKALLGSPHAHLWLDLLKCRNCVANSEYLLPSHPSAEIYGPKMSCVTQQTFPGYPLFASLVGRLTGEQQGHKQATWHSSLLLLRCTTQRIGEPLLSPCTGASLERATGLASIYLTSPKMHRAIGQPFCSSRQGLAEAMQTEAE